MSVTSETKTGHSRIFEKNHENLCLFLGVALTALGVGLSCLNWAPTPTELLLTRVSLFLLFGAWSHIGLTFSNLRDLPEFKNWFRRENAKSINPYLLWIAVILLVTVYCVVVLVQIPIFAPFRETWVFDPKVLAFLALALGNNHNIGQSFGLSLLYSRNLRSTLSLTEKEVMRLRRIDKIQRLCYRSLSVLGALQIGHVLGLITLSSGARISLLAIGLVLSTTILGSSLCSRHLRTTHQLLFNVRSFGFAFFGWNIAAGITASCIHGAEYMLLTAKMRKNSGLASAGSPRVGSTALVFALTATFAYLLSPRYRVAPLLFGPSFPTSLQLLNAVTIAVSFLHIFLDGSFFRFRTLKTQRTILPLLARQT